MHPVYFTTVVSALALAAGCGPAALVAQESVSATGSAATRALTSPEAWSTVVPAICARIQAPDFAGVDTLFAVDFGVQVADSPDPAAPDLPDSRVALQAAIDSAHAIGGGTVVLPAGHLRGEGPLELRSRVELHLPAGALLSFGWDSLDYRPLRLQRWEGTEMYNWSPLIYARDAYDLAITGAGTIHGNGAYWRAWRPRQKAQRDRLRDMGRDRVPVERRVFGDGFLDRDGDGLGVEAFEREREPRGLGRGQVHRAGGGVREARPLGVGREDVEVVAREALVEDGVVAVPVGLDVPAHDLVGGIEEDVALEGLARDLAVGTVHSPRHRVEGVAKRRLAHAHVRHVFAKAADVTAREARRVDTDVGVVLCDGAEEAHGEGRYRIATRGRHSPRATAMYDLRGVSYPIP